MKLRSARRIKRRARLLRRDLYALWLAVRSPEVPWYTKALGALILGYLLSPVDLIPDFIPVLGLIDDLIVVPAGIALLIRLIPTAVLDRCREQAAVRLADKRPRPRAAGVVVVLLWAGLFGLFAWLIVSRLL